MLLCLDMPLFALAIFYFSCNSINKRKPPHEFGSTWKESSIIPTNMNINTSRPSCHLKHIK